MKRKIFAAVLVALALSAFGGQAVAAADTPGMLYDREDMTYN